MNRKPTRSVITENAPSESAAPELLTELLSRSAASNGTKGVFVGKFRGQTDTGAPLVDHPDHPGGAPIPARTTVQVDHAAPDTPVVLVFEHDDPNRPIIIGVIQPPTPAASVSIDGEREAILEGKERIELRCGKAKIVLTADGKVLIKGTDIVSRSEGPNRIKGASIQIN